MIQFKENAPTDGQKDGQTLFYRTLLANAWGPISGDCFPFFCIEEFNPNHKTQWKSKP